MASLDPLSEEDKGAVFYETVISLKPQKHSFIECVSLPWDQFELLPGYFKESILRSEAEWSQHKKLIDFSARPGGFRRANDAMNDEMDGYDVGEKGGGDFPRHVSTFDHSAAPGSY
ncbi:hypothetical protein K435DRAFT_856279 [Dendrothele bispora CBS 962.96]|uniref:Cwf19-like protein C-terminal domain-containing protein n=1 Tax=Dendrothele bispora (strain CBS 962.96) TaxID=1314807 RepID=A0A4S8M9D1_DENBC|nr:hypothetical protein K435DRAFT_856279 [Dendrothele bispora CBS 962.96]